MSPSDLLTVLIAAIVISALAQFFLMSKPLTEQQRLALQTASKHHPLAEVLMRNGRATRHAYRQVMIALARNSLGA